MKEGLRAAALAFASILLLFILLSGNPADSLAIQKNSESGNSLQYGQARELSRLNDPRINESSGIATSIRNSGAFWTHNDSGDSARIFLISKSGDTLATVHLKETPAVDWEDIASFRLGEDSYVLIADVGNNARNRESFVLYIIREPQIPMSAGNQVATDIEAEPVWRIRFAYEDGPHDCEAVAVDPTESMIYLVTKEFKECKVYSMAIPPKESKQTIMAKSVASLKLPFVTAMDISPDGSRAVILTYGDAYAFSRASGETWGQAFAHEPQIIRTPARKQGESICYGPDGRTLYLTSESERQPLWELPVIGGR